MKLLTHKLVLNVLGYDPYKIKPAMKSVGGIGTKTIILKMKMEQLELIGMFMILHINVNLGLFQKDTH